MKKLLVIAVGVLFGSVAFAQQANVAELQWYKQRVDTLESRLASLEAKCAGL